MQDLAITSLLSALRSRSFDLLGLASARAHDHGVPVAHRLLQPEMADRAVIVVGASDHWWPRALACLDADPTLRAAEHPLEAHLERELRAALETAAARHARMSSWDLRLAHGRQPPSMRALASLSGLASASPSGLSAHAVFGTWISWFAAVVTDLPAPSRDAPATEPCASCPAPCEATRREVAARFPIDPDAATVPRAGWRAHVEVRAACPVGAAHRFSDDRIEYHYTHDRAALERALAHWRRCSSRNE